RVRPAESNLRASKEFVERKKNLQTLVKNLGEELQDRRDDFDLAAARLNLLDKIDLALNLPYKGKGGRVDMGGMGLARKALTLLQETKLKDEEKPKALFWQAQVLLTLGQAQEVHEALQEEGVKKALEMVDVSAYPRF